MNSRAVLSSRSSGFFDCFFAIWYSLIFKGFDQKLRSWPLM